MDFLTSSLRNLQSMATVSLETADLLMDFRQDVLLSVLKQVQQSVGDEEPAAHIVSRGVELTTIALNRQLALERDLLARLQQSMVGTQRTARPPKTREPGEPTSGSHFTTGETVRVTTRAGDGPVLVPLKLRNHHDTPQTVTLFAVKFEGTSGALLPTGQIHFHPERFTLAAHSATTAYVIIEIEATFRTAVEYWTEIRIGGSDPRRFPLCLMILAPDPAEPAAAADPLAASDHGESAL